MSALKQTPAQLRRLEKNLSGARPSVSATKDMSLILRILWEGWEAGSGRQPTYDDVTRLRVPMLNKAKKYLPELQRKKKTK